MNKYSIDKLLIKQNLPKDISELIFNFFTDFCNKCYTKQLFCYDCFYFVCGCEAEKKCSHCKILICNCIGEKVFKICECCENYLCSKCLDRDI